MRSIYLRKIFAIVFLFFFSCSISSDDQLINDGIFIYVLGVAQDGGYPQAGCLKQCCMKVKKEPYLERMVTSIAIVDNVENKCWIIDMSPDFPKQLHMINDITNSKSAVNIAGIFLTHAHIGHYSGLIHLGHEVMGAKNIPVYAMPRMKNFLEKNGPWNQLVTKSKYSNLILYMMIM
jgi:Predicted hydrolase of the metallo-beta-lactamase superfamily